MNAVVVGAGKMGLPVAVQLAQNGASVTACDIRQEVVDAINRGECPISEAGLPERLAEVVAQKRLKADGDTTAAVRRAEVIVVLIPVLLTSGRHADISKIEDASKKIAAGLQPGTMVCYETTLPVGTTRHLASILEQSGLKAGQDFDLVFSPERVKSQFVLNHLTKISKIVGGLTPAAAGRAERFYSEYLGAPVINVGTLEAAELTKLAGMVYRDVNVALANELARYAETAGVDLHSIIAAINSDGEAVLLRPGIGVGGHCTPVYPYFLINDAQSRHLDMPLMRLGRKLNDSQATCCLDRLEQCWGPLKGQAVLILGLGFRPEVKEHTYSTSFLLSDELRKREARVFLNDPLYTEEELCHHGFTPMHLDAAQLPPILVLSTGHQAYTSLDFADLVQRGVRVVLDGRGLWNPEPVRSAGIKYLGVGRP